MDRRTDHKSPMTASLSFEQQSNSYKYNRQPVGMPRFRHEIMHSQHNSSYQPSPLLNASPPSSFNANQSTTFITSSRADTQLERIHPTLSNHTNSNSSAAEEDTSRTNMKAYKFLPFIHERDRIGRLLVDEKSEQSGVNSSSISQGSTETYRKLYEKVQSNLDRHKTKLRQRQQAALSNASQPGLNALVSDSLAASLSSVNAGAQKKRDSLLGIDDDSATTGITQVRSPFSRFFVVNQDKIKGNRKCLEGSSSSSTITGITKQQQHSSKLVDEESIEKKGEEPKSFVLKKGISSIFKQFQLQQQQSQQQQLYPTLGVDQQSRRLSKPISSRAQFDELHVPQNTLEKQRNLSSSKLADLSIRLPLNLSSARLNQSSLASIPDVSIRKHFENNDGGMMSVMNLSRIQGAAAGSVLAGASTTANETGKDERSKSTRRHDQSTLSQRHLLGNSNHMKANSLVLGHQGQSQKSLSSIVEDRQTFSELFKCIKVTQNDIDTMVYNDPRLYALLSHREEQIANFSEDNVNGFFKDMMNLRTRARQLKKNINQIPEKMLINMRSNNQSPLVTAGLGGFTKKKDL